MKTDKNCIFCKILKGKAQVSIVYEDELSMAFMDIQPVNPGHILVIPKEHAASQDELSDKVTAHLFSVGKKVNAALRKSMVQCEGVNYLLADGAAAGQEVFHIHLHVFPRYKNDGFGFRFSEEYYKKTDRSTLDTIAADIRKHIA
jgi:histidine triad (HIT) family protein